jgi:hypothetical protein
MSAQVENLTLFIATYAAIISTIVLIWDAYKWKRAKGRIVLSVASNVLFFDKPTSEYDIEITVWNASYRPTEIIRIGAEFYQSWWQVLLVLGKLKIRSSYVLRIACESDNHLPHRLRVGRLPDYARNM